MRLILCWLGIWIFCVGLFAQNTKDNSSYLFDEFQDCLIVYIKMEDSLRLRLIMT